MIQWTRNNSVTNTFCAAYVDIYNKMTATTYNPLFALTSQSTNKTKYVVSWINDYTNKERYVKLAINISSNGTDNGSSGIISLGNADFPYGFYDVVIYQNNSNENIDPANAVKVIYTTMMNLKAVNNDAITYTEYTTNDADTDNVYITND
jgi:hypothetical protein